MLYVLFGQDAYRSRKKLREIIDRFYALTGGRESAVRVTLPESSRQEVEHIITTGSLFRNKQLIVLEEPSSATADVVAYVEKQLPKFAESDDIYVLWDRMSLDGKTSFGAAAVGHAAKAQEFGHLTAQESARFLDEEARLRGISLTFGAKQRILTDGAGDSWRLVQELEKAALKNEQADEKIVASADIAPDDRLIFNLTDAHGLSERAKAWQIYNTLLDAGMEPEKIFWRLISHVRTILSVHSLIQRGVAAADMPRAAGVHPFVAKKAALTAARISERDLKAQHASLVLLDFQTKQSRGDMALGLERILLNLSH